MNRFIKNKVGLKSGFIIAGCMAATINSIADEKPNFIFIITDQQSYDAIGALKDVYPNCNMDYVTPNLDRLVKNGISFTNTYCANAVSMPSRFALFTGQYGSSYGIRHNGQDETKHKAIRDMLPSSAMGNLFKSAGYDTYYGGKVHLPCSSEDIKNKSMYEPPKTYGFDVYYTKDERDIVGTKAAEIINKRADDSSKPFLLVASFINPHDICMEGIWAEKEMPADQKNEKKNERAACVQGVRDKADAIDEKDFFMKHAPELPFNFEETKNLPQNIKMPSKNFSENYWRRYRWIYRELVKLVDSHIGDILDAVDNNPKLKENTYIIFTSDHGEMLGAHKMITKGYPYEECQKVPFIISGPGIKHGDKDNSVVCNGTDILPTMCELANIKVGRTDGISLAKRITNKGDIPERKAIRIENNNFYTIVSGSYKYSYYDRKRMKKDIITLNEKNEFFVNTDKDPGEMRNSLNENRKHANELKRFVPLTK